MAIRQDVGMPVDDNAERLGLRETALVLGGGGLVGAAWELGVLAGLADLGVDLTDADVVIGTSAGAVVGAQITSGLPLGELYRAQLEATDEHPVTMRRRARWWMAWAMLRGGDPQRFRQRVGMRARSAKTMPESERRVTFQRRLPVHLWPDRRLLLTAVDAVSGEFVVFDRDAGVPLLDAVAASCAAPGVSPPITIGPHQYIDGGMRSFANADLAAGSQRVVVIAPITAGGGFWTPVADQMTDLRRSATVALVSPDQDAKEAIGPNALDPARRAPAARSGYRQATSIIDTIRGAWTTPAR